MKHTKETSIRRAVGVYIVDTHKRLLLTQRGPDARHEQYTWEAPGGEVEPSETFEEAAVRELREEIGITVRLIDSIYEDTHVIDTSGEQWHAKIFLAETDSLPTEVEPGKIAGFGWFSVDELMNLPVASYCKKDFVALREYFQNA